MIEQIRQIVAQVMGGLALTRMGEVTDYDPDTYSVRVKIQPTGEITGWLPLGAVAVGKGFGIAIGPNIGDQVRIDFEDGHWQAGMVGARFFNDLATPLPVPAGEQWLVHQSGSLLKFHNDGSVELKSNQNLNATVGGNLNATISGNVVSQATNWTHTGPMTISGLITGQGGLAISGGSGAAVTGNITVTSGDVKADGIGLKSHTHTDPQGGTTGPAQG